MIPSKERVIEVLKDVVYFPKGSNIIDCDMVKELEVGEDIIRFNLVLENIDDEKNRFLFDSAQPTPSPK